MACICLNFSTTTYASTAVNLLDYGIAPAYEIAKEPVSSLSIVGETAYCISSAVGTNVTSITVIQTLQKHWGLWIWNDVDGAEWTKTKSGNSVNLSTSKSGLEEGEYRLKSVFTLTDSNGKSEKITIYSETQTVG